MLDIVDLEKHCMKRLSEVLHNVDNRDFLWLQEIYEEAVNVCRSNGEPELMPKTPSQKNRRKKKCTSSVKNDQFARKRLSKRDGSRSRSSKRISQQKKNVENVSPCRRVTRLQAAMSARLSNASVKNPVVDLAKGRIPLVEIGVNERRSAERQMEKAASGTKKVDLILVSDDDESPIKRSKASLLVVRDTPEAKIAKQGREACKLKIANVTIAKTTENKESGIQEGKLSAQQQESPSSKTEPPLNSNESPQTPTAPNTNRRSVRRSLMGTNSVNSRASLVERYSLSSKRERMIRKSIRQSLSKKKTMRQSSSTCRRVSCHTATENEEVEEIIELPPKLDSVSHSQEVDKKPRMSLQSHKNSMIAGIQSTEQQQEGETKEGCFEKCDVQKQPQSIRRKASYKRAVNELDDEQHTEDELSPPRKKTLSPQCPASKVVRPFKTFLHTVQKNQMLMMTPGTVSRNSTIKSFLKQNTPSSVSGSSTIKSFLKQNTPLQTNLKEKERQRLENMRKKQEAEERRKQKMEEEKQRRLEEMKQKREERLRKVLQARERCEQMEEEKKRRLEQKHAQHEKNEKAREGKMAEEKVKKAAAAKKREELEARRKQEEEACKQKALQLEEDRRHKERMQKKREEELEKARKLAEQRQAELEKEKKLSAERELEEKKREQEKLRAQREHERQEKEKAVRLEKELMATKERLRKEAEEKEKQLQEQRKQEEQQKATSETAAKAANKQLNQTVDIENSPACNSYQMTPKAPKQPKIDMNNYGMDLNSDDSTDDESQPRKPIPPWASGNQLSQAIIQQYYKPPNLNMLFGVLKSPKLEEIFNKNKPRYFKRTSSAVWNSPPFPAGKSAPYYFKRC